MGTSKLYRTASLKFPWGLGPLFYRHLEMDKTTALRQNKGNYNAHMKLSQESVSEIKWWYDNIPTVNYPILLTNSKVDVIIYTDTSTKGWGAVKDAEKQGVDGQMKRPNTTSTAWS